MVEVIGAVSAVVTPVTRDILEESCEREYRWQLQAEICLPESTPKIVVV